MRGRATIVAIATAGDKDKLADARRKLEEDMYAKTTAGHSLVYPLSADLLLPIERGLGPPSKAFDFRLDQAASSTVVGSELVSRRSLVIATWWLRR